jgi:signal transduction histidine kinase
VGTAGAVAALVLAAGSLVLLAANAGTPREVPAYWQLGLAGCLGYGLTGGWLVRLRPALTIGWLMLGTGLVLGGTLLGGEYALWSLETHPGPPFGAPVLWLVSWTWVIAYLAVPLVLLQVLPDGQPLPGRWRLGVVLGAVAAIAQGGLWAVTPYDLQDEVLDVGGATNPVGIASAADPLVVGLVFALVPAALAVALASLTVRWRRGTGVERQRLKWVLLGAAATLALLGVTYLVPDGLAPWVVGVAVLPLPVACLLAAARYGLWDVDVVISRSLVYAALTAAVVAVYVAVVGLLGGLLGRSTGAPILATALVAVLAQPLHQRLHRAVNRLVHGAVDEPYAALSRLGERLEAARDPEAVGAHVLPEVVGAVARLLRVPAEMALRDGSRVPAGDPGPDALVVPLGYAGETLGELRVGTRPGGLSRHERRLLDGLARQAAVAVHGQLLGRDLQHSRELLVSAREEERRRLRRDLHDGVGPALAAAALQVETAREVYGRDPEAAGAILDRAAHRLRAVVDDVRTAVHGLRPATLDDLGLPAALVELAARFDGPGRQVTATVADVPGRSAAVDAAVYLVASEAVNNAARHAAPGTVRLDLSAANGGLLLTVRDDGRGLPAQPPAGVGLRSMRERADELAGSLDLAPAPGGRGTEVRLWLPLGQVAP